MGTRTKETIERVEPDKYKSLDEKTKEFCRAYVHDWNGTRAAMAVWPGAKKSTANSRASELLSRKRVKEYCDYLNENIEEVTGVPRTWVMQQHLKIVRSSIAHLHNTWIDRVDFGKLTPDQKDCIEEITTQTRTETAEADGEDVQVQVGYVKIKLYNKQKALDAITRLMGYEKAQRIDVTSNGKALGIGTTVNVQINIYNNAPPLASNEKQIKD